MAKMAIYAPIRVRAHISSEGGYFLSFPAPLTPNRDFNPLDDRKVFPSARGLKSLFD